MTYLITWDEHAIDQAARFLKDDPDGLRQLMDAVDLLAENPLPEGAVGGNRCEHAPSRQRCQRRPAASRRAGRSRWHRPLLQPGSVPAWRMSSYV
ncbi:hypothetical protein ACIQZN_24875 [Streptomyces sp. NPDC097595]|uniref:hypothetical protein n=1 Tax=Streptomyces sp. NPDC097595 TaxID=3366090 RepID=UPI003809F5E5